MIDYLPLKRITAMHAAEIHEALRQVADGGWYLRGEATDRFEKEYAHYIGTRHCIGVANGLEALTLILRAYKVLGILHEGDEIIVPANTFIASILSITENRLTPVLVEPRLDTFLIDDSLIEQAITPRTRAIMMVHLYGRCAYTPLIVALCQKHNLLLLEDNAQAHGCVFKGNAQARDCACPPPVPYTEAVPRSLRRTGSLGNAAAHSFYPGKNLGALGDAGAVTTDDDRLAETIRSMANYGSSQKYVFDHVGLNSRLDELQAAVLSVKLKYLDADNARRQEIANHYIDNISNPLIQLPTKTGSVYHIFPVLCPHRDRLQDYLKAEGVATAIHYPIPPHKQACYREMNALSLPVTERIHAEELSLPCHQAMTQAEVERVVELMNKFH
ncbi:MAG: DegT/DnrJ/EryC1/StrS family aminotransferase [Prevotella sp.]|nr:DegT/DnrJ/EryC1/StrS family aminotransferase [Prevotella sp.]